ncbi:TetR/AcrR family transcriptional regulator [Achromobacter xylosoxidans]|uniref:TetR/AcrR family transcriptional regulator n=1 Tax=Alcaligenes xylosoxydans xylosoxydans TaxID=85698 RepID=UPI00064DC55C|nr:TetR/AcrR family transcriptional regulator [Achromobacter xylosoxidans]KMJ89712.1 transcriptional regulator [Achromobacter xylosoxidans]MCM2572875.1 TetR/AcrR family transcriptional regulator [Achromobacter xylosoxidans]CUI93131.1 Fatty acid metabolism regulator protein [Achromobacter xylosoxidans]
MTSIPQPRKSPRQQRSQQTVDTILQATARVLAEHGYAGTNTNRIAETAGVSVGSLYQYFPNKNALIAALHDRHDKQMLALIDEVLDGNPAATLRERVAAIVAASLHAHLLEPALHRVLEREFPLFDQPRDHSRADQDIHRRMRHLLELHREEIAQQDRELATYVVLRIMESLVHAVALEPPAGFDPRQLEGAVVDAVMGYLGTPTASVKARPRATARKPGRAGAA